MRRDGHLCGKYNKYACGTLVGKTVLLVVLEVVLHGMFCEVTISVSQEDFTNVHINRTVVDLDINVVWGGGSVSSCRV